jgi:hypothetical protein
MRSRPRRGRQQRHRHRQAARCDVGARSGDRAPCPVLDQIFPGGVATYASGDPRRQPLLMEVLHSRVLSMSVPQWSQETRAGWVAELEADVA